MSIENNEYMHNPAHYFAGYNKSIQDNFGENQKEQMAFHKLTFDIFDNDNGRKYIEQRKATLTQQLCMIDLTANNSELYLASLRGSLSSLLEIEQIVIAYKLFIKEAAKEQE